MKNQILICCILTLCLTGRLWAQNKTLGVGATTPNANAALHVESPTGNQGFIMPRLNTAQRTAMDALLTAADAGLMLFDTDLQAIYIWDGTAWKSTADVSGSMSVSTSGLDTLGFFKINNSASFSHAVYAETNGDSLGAAVHGNNIGNGFGVYGRSAGSKFASAAVYGYHTGTGDAAGAFRIENSASTYSALYGETNGSGPAIFGSQIGMGRGLQVQNTNTANTEPSLRSYTAGTGRSGFFTVNNPASASEGIFSTTNGSGAAIFGESTGTGSAGKFVVNNVNSVMPALWAETNSDQPLSAPLFGLNRGTGDVAASFKVDNAANAFPALFVETNGTGRAATFRRTTTTGAQPAVFVDSQGGHGIWADHNGANGFAAIVQTINTANPNAAALAESVGTGPSVWALKSTDAVSGDALRAENQIAQGSAGVFVVSDAANTSPAISASSAGTGAAVDAQNTGAGNGFAGLFGNTNAANTFPAIQASTAGSGPGVAVFQTTGTGGGVNVHMQNTAGTTPGISVEAQGLGSAIWLNSSNAANTSPVVFSGQAGEGPAGHFEVTNASSGAAGLFSSTSGTGAAFQATTSTGFTSVYGRREGATNGNAGLFDITDAANAYPALQVNTVGTGPSGNFIVNNASSQSAALTVQTNGTGAGVSATTDGTGYAGSFFINNASNSFAAMYGQSLGSGASVQGVAYGTAPAGRFQISNTSSTSPALSAETDGTGPVAYFNFQGDTAGTTQRIAIFSYNGVARASIDEVGTGYFNNGTQVGGADLAEMFDVEGARNAYEPGDVLVISESTDRTVEKSNEANSTRVAGVYATKPGVVLTERGIEENLDDLVPMGVVGVIPTKVCLENGPIKRGDLLVTASRTGHAMKAIPAMLNGVAIYPTGAILGKALENFSGEETGLIKVLVNVK